MKLHENEFGERNVIKRYGNGAITVNERVFTRSVIITPREIVDDWRPATVDELTPEDLGSVAQLGVEVVILGTGDNQVFPAPRLMAPFADASVGVEVMDSGAAARTYNILASEGRNVAAAILM